ncbi:hypothetical protein RJ641_020256 [Dillenia turbinata]|uniref:Uncharacterized protein n=1 Tax=Dillenia turbinata TaxID=194707 RepID=A0AAN8ULR5_9MAGN
MSMSNRIQASQTRERREKGEGGFETLDRHGRENQNIIRQMQFLMKNKFSTNREKEMKRYRNGEIWDFDQEMPVAEVILGLDGRTTSTMCICMPFIRFSDAPRPNPLPVLARVVAGCSNHNSVGDAEKKTGLLCEQENRREMMSNHALLLNSTKTAKGRGSNGGANLVHHPRDVENNAPPCLLARPIWLFESASIGFVFALLF